MKSLRDKVAIVTGSSKGIGAQLAKVLAQAGASVIVNYAGSKSAADQVVAEIKSEGSDAIALRADVSQVSEVKSMFDAAIAKFGKIDILVNNAGIIVYKKIQDTTDEDFDRIFAVNVKGTFNTLREAATRIEDGGRIVNLSSSVTRLMLPAYGVYSATKGAVEQLTRVFAKEVGPRRITVNSISPGPTHTELFNEGKSEDDIKRLASMAALSRIGEPNDIARVILFLVSEEAAWVTGQNLGVNGGFA
ncbi:MAG: SDR family oxidoreductase [Desulfobacterales bacterium]